MRGVARTEFHYKNVDARCVFLDNGRYGRELARMADEDEAGNGLSPARAKSSCA
jgi:hypothetical protein